MANEKKTKSTRYVLEEKVWWKNTRTILSAVSLITGSALGVLIWNFFCAPPAPLAPPAPPAMTRVSHQIILDSSLKMQDPFETTDGAPPMPRIEAARGSIEMIMKAIPSARHPRR